MKKLTKRQITRVEKIISEKIDLAVRIHLDSLTEMWAKGYIEKNSGMYDFCAGGIWSTLDTLQMMKVITLKEYFVLKDYYDEKRWEKRDELRKAAA